MIISLIIRCSSSSSVWWLGDVRPSTHPPLSRSPARIHSPPFVSSCSCSYSRSSLSSLLPLFMRVCRWPNQCYKYGVKSVTCSWRTAPMGFKWPENFKTVPLLQQVTPGTKTCTFIDGSTTDVDAIIFCTGYKHHFPFLAPELRLKTVSTSPPPPPPPPCSALIPLRPLRLSVPLFRSCADTSLRPAPPSSLSSFADQPAVV